MTNMLQALLMLLAVVAYEIIRGLFILVVVLVVAYTIALFGGIAYDVIVTGIKDGRDFL